MPTYHTDSVVRESPKDVEAYFDRLWPLLRSITGDGVRRTHDIIAELVPLKRSEIPSGTKIFDWEVPKEWVVRNAYVITPEGKRILDVWENNLHLLNYSISFRGTLDRAELDKHLYSVPELPDAIPYITSYYSPRWGFSIPHKMREALPEGKYKVVVDTDLIDGHMTLSEAVLKGETEKEVLISTYTCHPSMANNELSGPLVAAFLYRRLAALPKRRLTYRFAFLPETIGAITYLNQIGDHLLKNMIAGYVVTCAGDNAPFTYRKSRRGNSLSDRAALYTLSRRSGPPPRILDFLPIGSDERQYCSPGFNLPVGVIARSIYTQYPEYHTSLDNRDFISFEAIVESVDLYFDVCRLIDCNQTYKSLITKGEPCLSKRNLQSTLGRQQKQDIYFRAIKCLLNFSDGKNDLLSIAERSGEDFSILDKAAGKCIKAELIKEIQET